MVSVQAIRVDFQNQRQVKAKFRQQKFNTQEVPSGISYPNLDAGLLQVYYCKNSAKRVAFRGIAERLPKAFIRNYSDALEYWKFFAKAHYTDICAVTPSERKLSKSIREENYSFLDQLKTKADKKGFIAGFVELTGFPDSSLMTEKIISEFKRSLESAAEKTFPGVAGKDSVLISGYDPVCSVGLGRPLPGSDMDKNFVLLKSPFVGSDEEFVDEFKGHLWNEMDQRLMSINHYEAFTNVYTTGQVKRALAVLDNYAKNLPEENVQPALNLRMSALDAVQGARFNIWLSEQIPDEATKVMAKNFAYFIETVRDGKKVHCNDEYFGSVLAPLMNQSKFSWFSNVCQMHAMENLSCIKPKLEERKTLEKQFKTWDIDTQYDFVKDAIKYMSGDNCDARFEKYFSSGTDYRRLAINDILTGKIAFFMEDGREYLTFKDSDTMKKYI